LNLKPFHTLVQDFMPYESVFMYQMPDTVKRAVLLMSGIGGAALDQDIPGYKRARLQAIIRETEFQSGYDLAKQVMTALDKSRVTSESVYILRVNPLHDPIAFARSQGGFVEFSINFETVYVEH
jgi:hypothetical protein